MESKHQCLEDEAEIGNQLRARLLLKYKHDITLTNLINEIRSIIRSVIDL